MSAPDHAPPPSPGWAARAFGMSWFSYFSYYFTRKNFSVVKKSLGESLHLDKGQLRDIDTGFLVAYAVGQVLNGFAADAVGPRRLVSIGMLISAAVTVGFAFTDHVFGAVVGIYITWAALNGLAQSSGWPGNGKLMASWFSTVKRGEVMGYWSTCYQAGGLVATLAASWLLGYGWRVAYVVPAVWVAAVALAYASLVRDRPSDVGFADPGVQRGLDAAERHRLRRAAWPKVLRNPMTWSLGTAYFCLKLMRYAFLFWLPFYLSGALHYGDQEAGYMSTAFEIGGIPFVIISGLLADRWFGKRRIAVAAMCMVLLCGALALYREVGESGPAANVIAMMLVGAFLFGADALVSGAAAQDLGGPHAAALACGMINGIGSIGGVVQGYVTVYVSDKYGWGALFEVFEVLALVGALALVPYVKVRPGAPDHA